MDLLPKCDANFVPLTPITFLKRANVVYANRTSVIFEGTRFTWSQTYERCCRLADSLRSLKVEKNDVVSVLAPNIPAVYEMHFAVPMAGAVLNAINTRLDAKNIATILSHSGAKVFFVDYQYVELASEALGFLDGAAPSILACIDDIDTPTGVRFGQSEYEQLVQRGNPGYTGELVQDEWDPIALNYTSGTTSAPKGVVYSHRGAYLSTLSQILGWEMGNAPVYLWSLPMFHCNGWTFTWGVAARGGTNICLRNTTAKDMYHNIAEHAVTHMCCAPVVFNVLLEAKPHERREITSPVEILTGGAPPPASLLPKIERLGFHVTHGYGLTETAGPALVCEWQRKWNKLPQQDQAKLKARQGISLLTLSDADVKDLDTMASLPRDGETMGEIVLRGSSIMKGYFKDPEATSKAFQEWMVCYWRYSVELESVLYRHPRVLEAAVVAMPHPKWGESPCAFISVKKNYNGDTNDIVKESDIIAYCKKNLPRFMVPKRVEFMAELPKNFNRKNSQVPVKGFSTEFCCQ
ncbi:ACYL-ACTIVATING ENZYME [Salix purpurea]|uniref:ACYL-ACTIVATING ENZYME n=1 Tax=Salix purpurea TaxID=77065 RepID=A0A9Q0VSX9_SALPP|nr:ACYL-ACTIVATING ENZYME [Salix purpurea]